MELHEYAAREVSSLIDRIVSEAEQRAHTLIDESRREHDDALAALRSQLAARDSQLTERDSELTARDSELTARDSELAARDSQLAAQDSQLAAQVSQLAAQVSQLAAQELALKAHVDEKEQVAVSAAEMRSQLEDLRRQFQAQGDELRTMSRDAELQRSLAVANMSAGSDLMEARAALEDSQADVQRLTRQFESALDELRNEHVSTLQQQAVARTVLPLDELLTMFESLATASSPSAVLTTIVSGLGREFSRVALFRSRASRLECVKHVGFDFEGDVSKVMIPISLDCLLTRAVTSKRTQTFVTGSSQEPCAVPFGGTPSCAVALPLMSGDASVAVIYADDSDLLEFGAVPAELLVKFADLVWQHAVLVLQRMSAAQKMLGVAPARHDVERLA